MADDRNREEPRFSRSGRVLKKSLKMKEMEDLEIQDDWQDKARRRLTYPSMHHKLEGKQAQCLVHGDVESNSVGSLYSISDISSIDVLDSKLKSGRQIISHCQNTSEHLHGLNNVYSSDGGTTWSTDISSEDDSSCSESAEESRESLKVQSEQRGIKKNPKRNSTKHQEFLNLKYKTGRKTTVAAKKHSTKITAIKNSIAASSYYSPKKTAKIEDVNKKLLFCELSKRLSETNRFLPKKKKAIWREDAEQASLQHSENYSKRRDDKRTKNAIVTNQLVSTNPSIISQEQQQLLEPIESNSVLGTAPIDIAAHLVLLGDNLSKIGIAVANLNHIGPGVYSSLLDMLLCSMGPLLCLTREVVGLERLPEDVFLKILDHIAYIIPGM